MESQHIILFGASGASGIAFVKHVLTLSKVPTLTLYVRSTSKLSTLVPDAANHPKMRIVEGELTSSSSLTKALTPSATFPPVTTAISFLGAYVTFANLINRDTSTPIADALRSTVLPALARFNIKRIMVLSTLAYQLPGEAKNIPWNHYINSFLPKVMVPQGNAEMKAIAEAVVEVVDDDAEWTIVRIPFLDDKKATTAVSGTFLQGFKDTTALSRDNLVYWILDEVIERKWVRGVPMVTNKE